ncbi:MAG: spermidine resistance protein [Alyxoria varia]|nr:MAG: spermidine resistance protein [Alyxoria varia]
MVNTQIPLDYNISPALNGTPQLKINPQNAFDLDSSNAFEGPEKLLEVWFASSADVLPVSASPSGLKTVKPSTWTEMLNLVHCRVLSVLESEYMDAYLLSESSLFVFPHKIVLKTCGTTTLISGLPKLLEIAAIHAGFPHTLANEEEGKLAAATTHRVFYSRKNFVYPDQQKGPHRSWRSEVRALDRLFRAGSAYLIGRMNGEHWYLYITEPDNHLTPPLTPKLEQVKPMAIKSVLPGAEVATFSPALDATPDAGGQDETLEILMTDLDEETANQFTLEHASAVAEAQYNLNSDPNGSCVDVFDNASSLPPELTTEGHALGTVVSETCGLSDLYPASKFPEARLDAYLFNPCGFSANGVIPAPSASATSDRSDGESASNGYQQQRSTHYFTVHVTPESECSYASFETNVPANQTGRETAETVEQVVKIFRPGRFSVTLFEAKDDIEVDSNATDNGMANGTADRSTESVAATRTKKPGPSAVTAARRGTIVERVKGYRRVDRIVHDLDGYDLVFRHFVRLDWAGGVPPRLGEEH